MASRRWSRPRLPEPSAQSEGAPRISGALSFCPQSPAWTGRARLALFLDRCCRRRLRRVGRPGGFVRIARCSALRAWHPMYRMRPAWAAVAAAAAESPARPPRLHPACCRGRRSAEGLGARRRRDRRRIRAVALRNHGNRPRRAAIGRPHQRHGVTRRHQRYHLDDAPALRIDDDPDLFTGGIDRAQRVSRALAHRTTQGLKSGGAHDGDDLVRRQSCDRIAGAGISRWRGGLRQGVSRYRKRGDKSRAEGDLVFQDRVPRSGFSPARGRRSTPRARCGQAR